MQQLFVCFCSPQLCPCIDCFDVSSSHSKMHSTTSYHQSQPNVIILIFADVRIAEMYTPLILLSFASLPLLAQGKWHNNIWKSDWIQGFASGGCPDSFSRGGKKVFCYYEGKKSPGSIDPCPCTHLLYKNVQIDPDSRLRLSSQVRVDLEHLRSSKPSLAVLLSIGGDVVESDTFRAIVSR